MLRCCWNQRIVHTTSSGRSLTTNRNFHHHQRPANRRRWWWGQRQSSSYRIASYRISAPIVVVTGGGGRRFVSTNVETTIIPRFEPGLASLAPASVLGVVGNTVVTTTLTTSSASTTTTTTTSSTTSRPTSTSNNHGQIYYLARALREHCDSISKTPPPLTVDYRQRHHAVGTIPASASRTDNRRPTTLETLASRAIDRSLRPLLKNTSALDAMHITASVQSCDGDLPTHVEGTYMASTNHHHPVALAINTASIVSSKYLSELVASVFVRMYETPKVSSSSSSTTSSSDNGEGHTILTEQQDHNDEHDILGELLYAGTRHHVVMMEYWGNLNEAQLLDCIHHAHENIQPLLDAQHDWIQNNQNQQQPSSFDNVDDDDGLYLSLGLLPNPIKLETDTLSSTLQDQEQFQSMAKQILDQAIIFCQDRLGMAPLRMFGVTEKNADRSSVPSKSKSSNIPPTIHKKDHPPLLSKSVRGRREAILWKEIQRLLLLQDFQPTLTPTRSDDLQMSLSTMLQEDPALCSSMVTAIHSKLVKQSLHQASKHFRCRSDGRGSSSSNSSSCCSSSSSNQEDITDGCSMIRPITLQVPALPDVVHGSALFRRGETQVLCTTTLGPPKDGILITDPYLSRSSTIPKAKLSEEVEESVAFSDLPVGSLRYLRTQEHLESDLNTRRVRADREQTGDSGTLKERRRAFLQYDFPSFSKGEVSSSMNAAVANRREIGHGVLAERAILPILPPPQDFPYAIRMTSEVTSSNGSSSMASVCGATLALLDAGVPIRKPVAGISVGLATEIDSDPNGETNKEDSYQLLLDITGTEDHYGGMDFKIAGTDSYVTALQLDVKQPLPLDILPHALELAKQGRRVLLKEMERQSQESSHGTVFSSVRQPHRPNLKDSAPRVEVVRFDPMRKKDLLGPGGIVIRQMEDRFQVSLDLTQEGQCLLFGDDKEMVRKAKAAVMDLVADVVVGGVYDGTVIEIRDFGAIIELLRNKEGLCHVSEMAERDELKAHPQGNMGLVDSLLTVGQTLEVVCTAVDPVQGTIRLRPVSKLTPKKTSTRTK